MIASTKNNNAKARGTLSRFIGGSVKLFKKAAQPKSNSPHSTQKQRTSSTRSLLATATNRDYRDSSLFGSGNIDYEPAVTSQPSEGSVYERSDATRSKKQVSALQERSGGGGRGPGGRRVWNDIIGGPNDHLESRSLPNIYLVGSSRTAVDDLPQSWLPSLPTPSVTGHYAPARYRHSMTRSNPNLLAIQTNPLPTPNTLPEECKDLTESTMTISSSGGTMGSASEKSDVAGNLADQNHNSSRSLIDQREWDNEGYANVERVRVLQLRNPDQEANAATLRNTVREHVAPGETGEGVNVHFPGFDGSWFHQGQSSLVSTYGAGLAGYEPDEVDEITRRDHEIAVGIYTAALRMHFHHSPAMGPVPGPSFEGGYLERENTLRGADSDHIEQQHGRPVLDTGGQTDESDTMERPKSAVAGKGHRIWKFAKKVFHKKSSS